MPARYKPNSEYKKKFRWHESVKSASFTPVPEQKAPKAGLGSGDLGYVRSEVREPPLQRRRKPLESQLTDTTKQVTYVGSESESDTIGKAKPSILASAKTYKIPTHHDRSKQRKIPSTAPIKLSNETRPAGIPSVLANNELSKAPTSASSYGVPNMGQTKVVSTHRKDRHHSGQSSDSNKNNNKATSRHSKGSPRNSDKVTKNSDKAQPNIALQYQVGIQSNRPKSAKFLSEYQRQFEWRKPAPKESPLIAAEQMIHRSNTNLTPYVPDKIPRHTEYQKQFKAWQPIQPPHQDLLMENAKREIKAKYMVKTKSKKSKKSGNTPDKMRPAGVTSVTTHENIEQLKQSQNPHHPFFPHSNIRKWKTEYKCNFKSPEKFAYEDGVWKGAGPPHIQPKDDSSTDTGRRKNASPLRRTKSHHDLPNWFSEVVELRQKAQEYQQRARGTHFSREHLAQLIARQAQEWEASTCSTTASSATSSLSAYSADKEGPKVTSNEDVASRLAPRSSQDNNNNISPARRKLAWTEADKDDSPNSIGRIPTPEGFKGSVSVSSDEFEIESGNGRPPTPQLKDKGIEQRHHLQLTTPAIGGAILTSPQANRKRPVHTRGPARTYPAHITPPRTQAPAAGPSIIPGGTHKVFDLYSSDEDDNDIDKTITPPRPQQTRVIKAQPSPPPAGVSTRDPHPLDQKFPSPTFQRHSKNLFETNPMMREMPRGINDPPPHQTWAAPRDGGAIRSHMGGGSILDTSDSEGEDIGRRNGLDDGVRNVRTMPGANHRGMQEEEDRPRPSTIHGARQGPLDRPNSGSMHGRPMTAFPSSRTEASSNPDSGRPTERQSRPDAGQTWTVPRQSNVDAYNRANDMVLDSPSDRLSMSGISSVSSSTLASEVLDRARKRRDEFWGTP